ncbi:hypothetical protein [Tunturibacter empetritectus]|uniref:Uncharacterized protein n=1 Tax=Tunturiibacter empetritectus TaxID=3069691 RepID=A0A7W8IEJ2_9BACT|nr:hypothetical protein [Edaphobacter lichenicola]MBB5315744.1 hypothetical protein [Edaphobacter lichenicola]
MSALACYRELRIAALIRDGDYKTKWTLWLAAEWFEMRQSG